MFIPVTLYLTSTYLCEDAIAITLSVSAVG
jgi:hypothetical protein